MILLWISSIPSLWKGQPFILRYMDLTKVQSNNDFCSTNPNDWKKRCHNSLLGLLWWEIQTETNYLADLWHVTRPEINAKKYRSWHRPSSSYETFLASDALLLDVVYGSRLQFVFGVVALSSFVPKGGVAFVLRNVLPLPTDCPISRARSSVLQQCLHLHSFAMFSCHAWPSVVVPTLLNENWGSFFAWPLVDVGFHLPQPCACALVVPSASSWPFSIP